MKISVVGSGGWGIASAIHLYKNGHDVTLWSFDENEAEMLRTGRTSPAFLSGVMIPDGIRITTDISCICGDDLTVLVTPSFAIGDTCLKMTPHISEKQPVVLLSKGFDPGRGHCLLSETMRHAFGKKGRIAVLSGPSHAEEVARGILTSVVAASADPECAALVQEAFMSPLFRVYTSADIVGVQLGGAIKNIIAIASGISTGMGYGDNTRAMLITRGVNEVSRLGVMMGGKDETFWGLSGIGDTIVTCTSAHSRNYRAGLLIGKGVKPDDAVKQIGATVEGYYATLAVHELRTGLDVELPICDAMYEILYKGADVSAVAASLVTRKGKNEF